MNTPSFIGRTLAWRKLHPKSFITIILALGIVGYFTWSHFSADVVETRYVLGTVEKGTLISSISGTGQVSASTQIDMKPKVSGDIVYVGAKSGDELKAGTLIAQIDSRDAQKAVRDAETSLETAKLSLDKILAPADALSVLQSEHTLERSKESKANAEADLVKSYEDAFNNVSNAFLDLPGIMTGLQDLLYSTNQSLGGNEQNINYYTSSAERYDDKGSVYGADTEKKYQIARAAYDATFQKYKAISRSSDTATIEKVLADTYVAARNISEAVKSTTDLIQFYKDTLAAHTLKASSIADTHLATLNGYTGKTNSQLSTLLSITSTIVSDKNAIVNATRSIEENTGSFDKLKAGADDFDIRSARITVDQRADALKDAQETLANYYIRAPWNGKAAKVSAKKGDSVTSGSVIATFITEEKIAEILLNEVDIAKVAVGQAVTLTFDAVDGLTISGKVAEVDSVGTVSQGVVNYAIKISFDTDDARVKPGMSVSAAVITEVKQDVVMVPNSAVKTQGDASYVEVFDPAISETGGAQGVVSATLPARMPVVIGSSNDTSSEIVSGVAVGTQVVTRTITGATTATAAPSIFSAAGVRTPGSGGGTRSFTR